MQDSDTTTWNKKKKPKAKPNLYRQDDGKQYNELQNFARKHKKKESSALSHWFVKGGISDRLQDLSKSVVKAK